MRSGPTSLHGTVGTLTEYTYIGSELELFSHASNWKAYHARLIRPYLGDEVLEVGAGIGATTASLYSGNQKRWVCLEPDLALARWRTLSLKSISSITQRGNKGTSPLVLPTSGTPN